MRDKMISRSNPFNIFPICFEFWHLAMLCRPRRNSAIWEPILSSATTSLP